MVHALQYRTLRRPRSSYFRNIPIKFSRTSGLKNVKEVRDPYLIASAIRLRAELSAEENTSGKLTTMSRKRADYPAPDDPDDVHNYNVFLLLESEQSDARRMLSFVMLPCILAVGDASTLIQASGVLRL